MPKTGQLKKCRKIEKICPYLATEMLSLSGLSRTWSVVQLRVPFVTRELLPWRLTMRLGVESSRNSLGECRDLRIMISLRSKETVKVPVKSRKVLATLPCGRLNIGDEKETPETREMIVKRGESVMNDYNQNEIHADAFEDLNAIMKEFEKQIIIKIAPVKTGSKEDSLDQVTPEKDTSKAICGRIGISCEDIMSFLGQLEEGSMDELSSMIPEAERINITNPSETLPKGFAFKEDLAVANLQLEEKNATIVLLKDELRNERKSACEKLEAQRKNQASKLHAQEEKYKAIVKRHQKLIEQQLDEKQQLTETFNALANRLKEAEAKFQRDLRTVVDRHAVELQRAKEHCAAAERIRRERWVETRTTRIKEMTVKGLEPELRNMIEQHEGEIQKLRNNHMQELQDTELRLVRQSNQQLEQLRLELNSSHEKMLADEKSILWTRYKENLEEQERQSQEERKKLVEEVKRERSAFLEEESRHEYEREKILQETQARFEQEIQALKRQQVTDKKTLEECLRTEWEMWLADYKRQQLSKFERAENRIRVECNRERDRQIELAIERLEQESVKAESSLRQSFENKMKSFTEKYDMDMQTMIENETVQKEKARVLREKVHQAETDLEEARKKLQGYSSDLSLAENLIKTLTEERDSARRIARQEIEGEKRELEEKIGSLYREINQGNIDRETSMAQLHSRIKLVMTQKVLIIRNLTKELSLARTRCEHLEKLLDQQRREFILRSLE